jgi:hypothetical protein
MNTNTTSRNWKYLGTLVIVRAYLIGALVISFSHIVSAAHLLQLNGWQAWTTPFAIDGFAMLGMIARSHSFAARTRTIGLRVQVVASLLSLACNIFAGHTTGERVYGAMIVAAYVFSEWFGDQMAPAEVDAAASVAAADELAAQAAAAQDAARKASRSAAAQQAAVTRKANAAAQAKLAADAAQARAAKNEARRLARSVKALEVDFAAADAPVSPAPMATTYM